MTGSIPWPVIRSRLLSVACRDIWRPRSATRQGQGQVFCIKVGGATGPCDHPRRGFPRWPMDVLAPVLPVLARPDRQPQLFDTMTEWRRLAEAQGAPLWEVAVAYENGRLWLGARAGDRQDAFHRRPDAPANQRGLCGRAGGPESPFKPNLAALWERRQRAPGRLTDDLQANTLRWAFGAGAGIPGVETVPGPMGSGGGYIYAALRAVKDARGLTSGPAQRAVHRRRRSARSLTLAPSRRVR